MKDLLHLGVAGTLCVAGLSFGTAANAVVVHGDFVGSTVTYFGVTEASADPSDPEPLYGVPTVTADALDFNPTANFVADAPPTDTTDGSLTFSVGSNSTDTIDTLIISESGTYTFTGSGNNELVAATLQVQLLDRGTSTVIATLQDSFLEQYDSAPLETGAWDLDVTFDLSALGLTEFDVVVNNILQTTGIGPATAMIAKTDFDVNVPEPATAALLGLGGLAMLRRRTP